MNLKKTKIGIIGLGYVGGALENWFRKHKKNCELFLYDKFKNIGSVEEVNRADVIFVAVPTPFRGGGRGYDDSAVKDALRNIKNGKVVVIKSTILPGSTNDFQKQYLGKTILFNPEFLRAKTANQDFLKPDRQVLGFANSRGKAIAPKILKILPKASFSRILRAKEAEMIKYFSNTYLATRVVFANQIYDFCNKLGDVRYDVVKECLVEDPRIGDSHFDVWGEGYRGYGGGCFPKDVKAFLGLAKKLRVNIDLIKAADSINEKLVKQRRLRKQ